LQDDSYRVSISPSQEGKMFAGPRLRLSWLVPYVWPDNFGFFLEFLFAGVFWRIPWKGIFIFCFLGVLWIRRGKLPMARLAW